MTWNNLYSNKKFCLKNPAEEVVDIVPLLRSRKLHKILDLGYGAGRHIVYLAKQEFQLFGIDISKKGEIITKKWLRKENLTAELKLSDMTIIPYPNYFFDACICRGVITHNTLSEIQKCIAEIYRTLKFGGIVMCTFISRESSEYKTGYQIEENTFVPTKGIEKGIPHHFVDKAETQMLMSSFKTLQIYHMKHKGFIKTNSKYVSAHWVYVGEK